MRYSYLILALILSSCFSLENSTLPSHTGAVNEIVIVIDDPLWEGACGDSLRHYLNSEVPGLSWIEPLFDIIQINSTDFGRIFETHRNLIIVQKGQKTKVYFNVKPYSHNQWFCIIEYETASDLQKILGEYLPIISHQIEQKEQQRYNSAGPPKKPLASAVKKFNLNFALPNKYKAVLDTNGFSWYEYNPKDKEIIKGVFVYEYAGVRTFNATTLLMSRDSVLKQFVLGVSDSSYMTTEHQYSPHVSTHNHDNMPILKVKGLWKMSNAFMGGSFVSNFINDTANNRVLALEGFLFSPGKDKRNRMKELEWLISDFKIHSSN